MDGCELCESPGGEVVWKDDLCRVIRVAGADGDDFPGFCRVVWHAHVGEMSDLPAGERRHLMNVVFAVETALRSLTKPDKINLASLGNAVPHLHWHVIPRWRDDSRFPASVWAEVKHARATRGAPPESGALHAAIATALSEEVAG